MTTGVFTATCLPSIIQSRSSKQVNNQNDLGNFSEDLFRYENTSNIQQSWKNFIVNACKLTVWILPLTFTVTVLSVICPSVHPFAHPLIHPFSPYTYCQGLCNFPGELSKTVNFNASTPGLHKTTLYSREKWFYIKGEKNRKEKFSLLPIINCLL